MAKDPVDSVVGTIISASNREPLLHPLTFILSWRERRKRRFRRNENRQRLNRDTVDARIVARVARRPTANFRLDMKIQVSYLCISIGWVVRYGSGAADGRKTRTVGVTEDDACTCLGRLAATHQRHGGA
jgi:hypothetical protein